MVFEPLLQVIFDDIRDCDEQMGADREAFFRQFHPFLAPTINVGGDQMIFVSRKSTTAIREIARIYRENSPEYRRASPQNDMVELVSCAIGSVLSASAAEGTTEFPIPTDPTAFWVALREQLKRDLADLNRELTHLFGAWVVQGDAIPSIDIGPVRFSLRAQWVYDAVAVGILSDSQAFRLTHYWEHGGTIDPDPTEGNNGFTVEWIADAVGPCPWICAVRVVGHTDTRSRQKALLAARIAFAAISLAWKVPSERAKETGLIFDIGPHRTRHTFTLRNDAVPGAYLESAFRLGRHLPIEDAADFLAKSGRMHKTVGTALNTFLSTNPLGPKRLLEEVLCHALIWFGEACNEPLDFMAIVKFAAALDTLAKGRQVRGICELVQRRFPVSDMDAPFLKDGTSAKQLVEQIYETGRSRIIHGTRSSLIDDLDKLRARAELLATMVLRASIHWLDSYIGPDDVSAFTTSP